MPLPKCFLFIYVFIYLVIIECCIEGKFLTQSAKNLSHWMTSFRCWVMSPSWNVKRSSVSLPKCSIWARQAKWKWKVGTKNRKKLKKDSRNRAMDTRADSPPCMCPQKQPRFYRVTLCVSVVFAVAWCPSVRPSVRQVRVLYPDGQRYRQAFFLCPVAASF